jgi:parallel beta-helix repeat protein
MRAPVVTLPVLLLLAAPLRAETLKVPADFATIQEAVDAAVAGDTVLVSKGTWAETVSVTTSGIRLQGKGATIDARYLGNCIEVEADDVVITGFTLVNGGLGQALLAPDGGPEAGGLLYSGSGADIGKLVVRACDDWGIRLAGTGAIDKCDVRGCDGPGIAVETPSTFSQIVTEVTRNTVRNCRGGFYLQYGPFLVDKNRAENNTDDGITVDIPVPLLEGIPEFVPSRVTRNTADGNVEQGFVLVDGAGFGMLAEKNVAHANGWGMFVEGFELVLDANTIEDNATGGLLLNCTAAVVAGNEVRRNGQVGILVSAFSFAADGAGSGLNTLAGNAIEANAGDGVRVASDSNVLDGNSLKDNLGDGVDIESGVTGNQLLANTALKNRHDGLDNSGADTLFTGNVSKDNGGADLAGTGTLGAGNAHAASADNVSGDGSDLDSEQELDLETID